jgi:hypothetical protein
MNCSEARERFSDHLDGALDRDALDRLQEHLRGCATCVDDLASLKQATDALRTLPVPEASQEEVQVILATVHQDAAPRKGRLLGGWTHAVTAVASAAAMWLILGGWRPLPAPAPAAEEIAVGTPADVSPSAPIDPGSANPAEEAPEDAPEPAPAPLRLIPVRTQLDEVAGVDAAKRTGEAIELAPGESWQSDWFPELALARNAAGELLVEARLAPPPEPRIVERVVERVEYVPVQEIPLEVDLEQVADLIGRTRDALPIGPRTMLDWVASREPRRAPVVSPSAVAQQVPAPTPPRREAEVVLQAQDYGVTILDHGSSLRLETRGPLTAIVPALIAHLDDARPAVVELVERRLEMIRETYYPASASPLADATPAPPETSWTDLFTSRSSRAAEPQPPRERWAEWWFEQSRTAAIARADLP